MILVYSLYNFVKRVEFDVSAETLEYVKSTVHAFFNEERRQP